MKMNRVGYIFKETIQLQSFPYLQEPCLLDPEKDHDHFIIKCLFYGCDIK